jgi:Rap1a immunity proteins
MRVRRWLITCLTASLGFAAPAFADASAVELSRTCQSALDNEYHGTDAAMCDWWVRPCGVCGEEKQVQWCIPPATSNPELAALIVREIDATPAVHALPAHAVVDKILATRYPCARQSTPNR